MITNKQKFIEHFRELAERDADLYRPKDREAYLANWLDRQWEAYVLWYKEKYPKAYRDSLTLEQLYRLDH